GPAPRAQRGDRVGPAVRVRGDGGARRAGVRPARRPRRPAAATRRRVPGDEHGVCRAEATARALEPGDLVFVDTDAVGVEGYFFCVSRTFLCGDVRPTPAQREV